MERAEKREAVAQLGVQFKASGAVVVAGYQGMTVAHMSALRGRVRAVGGTVRVAKNRLAKLAIQGTDLEHMGSLLKGPTVILSAKDPVAVTKVATEYAKVNDKFVILGGGMGKTALNPDGVKQLASLPSLDELRAKIVGVIAAPATKLATIINAPGGSLARVIQAHADKGQDAA